MQEICIKCKKHLEYHERHYISELKKEVSVYCSICFRIEMCKRTGKKLTLV